MKERKNKWRWIVLLAVLAVIAAAVALFLWFAPKLALSAALPKLFGQLEERFQDDPMGLLLGYYQVEGTYTADVVMTAERDITGPVTYEMTAQTDGKGHRFFADGTISSPEKSVNVSAYLDTEFVAVSSEELVQGIYYGITYDTFSSDIRKLPLFRPFVSDEALARWDSSIQGLKEKMSREYPSVSLPQLSQQDMKKLLLGIAALPCHREKVSVPVNGETLSCRKLDYTFDGKQLGKILEKATGKPFPEDTSVRASFYLYKNAVVGFVFQYQQGQTVSSCHVTFGTDPLRDTLTFQAEERGAGETKTYALEIDTSREGDALTQTWRYSDSAAGAFACTYTWQSATGTMRVSTDVVSEPARLQLTETDAGLRITTEDFGKLLQVATGEYQGALFDGAECSMTLRGGSQIETPPYRNLDTWTFDDFLILLSGLGSLIGLPSA